MKLLSILVSIKREVWGLFILQIYTYLGFMLHRPPPALTLRTECSNTADHLVLTGP